MSTQNKRKESLPVLTAMSITGTLRFCQSEVTVTQTYTNNSSSNIEAVYTFPLPLDATLLDLMVTLNGKEYRGTVMEKAIAEKKYEGTISEGDSAIMLENIEPGLYTMNVGNLLPGEECSISFSYGMFHSWQEKQLRLSIPTTTGPRFGNPLSGTFQPHQVPLTDLLTENRLSLSLALKDDLATATVNSPSHSVTSTPEAGTMTISLQNGKTLMDRDFILLIEPRESAAINSYQIRDGEEYLVWSPFHLTFKTKRTLPLRLTIVVDCSGSMSGDSISQAKIAMQNILKQLKSSDRFNVIRFGSNAVSLTDSPKSATKKFILNASEYVHQTKADMGGTETEKALLAALKMDAAGNDGNGQILLITDGEIYDWRNLVARMANEKCRVFTVGVGTSVAEPFVRNLAEKTGGSCELVSPNEEMADRIVRHFQRMRQFKASEFHINASSEITRTWSSSNAIFSGDTFHLFAWSKERLTGAVTLNMQLENGTSVTQSAYIMDLEEAEGATLKRLCAGLRLRSANQEDGKALALSYELPSQWTNYCAVIDRAEAEKAESLPMLKTVSQMLQAGWGGSGTVKSSRPACSYASPRCESTNKMKPVAKAAHRMAYSIEKSALLEKCSPKLGVDIFIDFMVRLDLAGKWDALDFDWESVLDTALQQKVLMLYSRHNLNFSIREICLTLLAIFCKSEECKHLARYQRILTRVTAAAKGISLPEAVTKEIRQLCDELLQKRQRNSVETHRVRPVVNFIEDNDDEYDIPAFLRKSTTLMNL
jgi:Ca-activated chloride channel family protein